MVDETRVEHGEGIGILKHGDRAEACRRNQKETTGDRVATLMESHVSPDGSRNHSAARANLQRRGGMMRRGVDGVLH